jgi:hypothetical protein
MHDGYKVCIAIVAIMVVEVAALITGHNGTILRLALVAISGLGGFSLAQFFVRRRP